MNRASLATFWVAMTILISLCLYHTSYRVEKLRHDLLALNSRIQAEQKTLHILKAEWVFLSNPSRIEKAARKHLDLKPTTPTQVAKIERLADVLANNTRSAALLARAAAYTPRAASTETGRVNTRLSFRKGQDQAPRPAPMPWAEGESFAFATPDGSTP